MNKQKKNLEKWAKKKKEKRKKEKKIIK